jgi:hypothetical protein
MPTPEEWSRAFARQARADFDTWNAVQSYLSIPEGVRPIPRCQKLHFLQMACEKLAKAHLLKAGSAVSDLEQSHAYVAKQLPLIVWNQMLLDGENERIARSVRDQCRRIAREVELLSPAVTGGGRRRENCEYPWESGGKVFVPAEWAFSALELVTEPQGRNILKRISGAIARLCGDSSAS